MKLPAFLQGFDEQAHAAGFALDSAAPAEVVAADGVPTVTLPGGQQRITDTAAELGVLLAPTRCVFNRGGQVVRVALTEAGQPLVQPVKPAGLASAFESVARLVQWVNNRNGGELVPAVCYETQAKLIGECAGFIDALPRLILVTACPVLVAGPDGKIRQVAGYDPASGIFAGGALVPEIPLDEAVRLLHEILADFRFASEGDRARAMASMITPALLHGGLLHGRAPLDLGEADDSQAGKGYRNKITAAIYNARIAVITQKKGGVGALEESFSRQLLRGSNFISIDNLRGSIDCPALESFATEDSFHARAPYGDAEIDPTRVIVMLTSNKAEVTRDLANRCSCVRILKQPVGFAFRMFANGTILDEIRAHQALYLGAVFAVVRAWWAGGCQRTADVRHDFREWAKTLDWICRTILGTCPIMDGHGETQIRIATPVLGWLRGVALVVKRKGRCGQWLRTSDMLDLLEDEPCVDIPGMREDADLTDQQTRSSVLQACGRRLKQCFKHDALVIDGIAVRRRIVQVQRQVGYGGLKETPEYCFGEPTPTNGDDPLPDPALIEPELAPDKPHSRPDAPDRTPPSTIMTLSAFNMHVETNGAVRGVSAPSAGDPVLTSAAFGWRLRGAVAGPTSTRGASSAGPSGLQPLTRQCKQ